MNQKWTDYNMNAQSLIAHRFIGYIMVFLTATSSTLSASAISILSCSVFSKISSIYCEFDKRYHNLHKSVDSRFFNEDFLLKRIF